MFLRRLFIRRLTPFIWRISENRKLAALQEFSDTELDSGWQSLYTLTQIQDPKAKAELFSHALDEFYHADLFNNVLQSYASSPLLRPVFSRDAILRLELDRSAVLEFLVQVYVGESAVNRDFVAYAQADIDESIRSLFKMIKKDEEGHEEVSWDLMLQYADGNIWKLRYLLVKKYLEQYYTRYVNFSSAVGKFMLGLLLSVLYYVAGSIFFVGLRRRLTLDRGTQLEILRDQINAYRDQPGGSR